jgi:CHAT domain-containing protein/tetratricopeptide (TPR) repeat protein
LLQAKELEIEIISANIDDTLKTFQQYNSKEKQLYGIIKISDSLSEINKKNALDYLRNHKIEIENEALDNSLLADYYHVYGKLLVDNGKDQIGLDTLSLSLVLKVKVYGNNDTKLAKTYNYIGIANFMLHNYEEALNNYSKAAEILNNNKFFGRDLFDAYLNIGIVKANLGIYDKAFAYFERASEIVDESGSIDNAVLARFYNNYGLLTTMMGKIELANSYFNISEKYYHSLESNNFKSLAALNLNKGVNYFNSLNYTLSSLFYNKTVKLFKENNPQDPGIIRALSNLCVLSRELGEFQASLDYGHDALNNNPSEDMKLVLFQNLARTYEKMYNYAKAKDNFKLALLLTEQSGFNPRHKFDLYILYADYLMARGDNDLCYSYYKKALDIEGDLNGYKTQNYAFVLSKIGFCLLKTEDKSRTAQHYFNRSIEIWRNHIHQDKNGIVNESFHDLRFALAYWGKSQALVNKYNLDGGVDHLFEGLNNYEWLLEQLERISRNLQKENQEIIREQLYPIYNEAIDLSFKLYELTSSNIYQKKAFLFSEKSKSAILLSSIQNMNALKTSDLPKDVLLLDQNLNEEINAVKKQLFDEKQKSNPFKKKLSFFENRLVNLLQTHDSLVSDLEKNHKKYYALKYDLSIIEFNELNKKLSSHEALVEYQLFDSSLYIFTLRNKKLFTKKLIVDSSFYESLDYVIGLNKQDLSTQTRSDFNMFIHHSYNLYNYLIKPINSHIKDKNLIIIPSGLLGYLPFEILVKPGGKIKELDYKNLNYLLKEFSISYAYSSTLRFSPYFNNPIYKTNLSILYMSPDYDGNNSIANTVDQISFKKLPFARMEVDELQKEFGGKAIIGKDAKKSCFIKAAPNYDILHLAMHTNINDSLPMYSNLVFSQFNEDSETRFLHTSEIYALDLKASMVTLSACNTGSGILQKGEGIMSLARGFVFAGVPSVVMTLWEVQDESGLQVMKAFYGYLSAGLSKDKAMQLAKLDMLESANMIKSHPNIWSAYIVTGDTAPINIQDEKKTIWPLLLFVIPLVLIFVFYRRMISNNDY